MALRPRQRLLSDGKFYWWDGCTGHLAVCSDSRASWDPTSLPTSAVRCEDVHLLQDTRLCSRIHFKGTKLVLGSMSVSLTLSVLMD